MLKKTILNHISSKPGVYLFKKNNEIIYIGKAKNLKKRLTSHFAFREEKSQLIINEANNLETIIVTNEKEALLLEASLIYKHKPKYNVMLKGNEFYPYIRISDDNYPYVEVTRNRKKDGIYFGPYTNIKFTKLLVEILQKTLKFRTCKKDLSKIKKPCMFYHLGYCLAPCIQKLNIDEYSESINKLKSVLKGDFEFIKQYIETKMNYHSKMLDFENAIKYRDLLMSFEKLIGSQGVILSDKRKVDYIVFEDNNYLILKVRGGILLSKLIYEAEIEFEEFLYQFYFGLKSELPERIVTKNNVKIDFEVPISTPKDNNDQNILKIAEENLLDALNKIKLNIEVLKQMKEILNLSKIPRIIEGTDISHRSGKYTVASLIVFENGKPRKELYRRYKLGNILNDYESIKQLILKRYSKHPLPDLIFVDGGKGQVNSALEALKEMNLNTNVVGLAKEAETIITPDKVITLPYDHPVLRALVQIRDETHRVANKFSGKLYLKNYRTKILDEIPGIGPKRKKLLLKTYGSIENIRNAPIDELEKLIGKKLANRLKEEL
ncbi:MAG: excinuclease ABC subunit UvrC [Thermosipho sp. (in: Bacteria)]|nr:excinuclease ABC subunit UvrC [Thermosipho sp. (in: thermotogales)]